MKIDALVVEYNIVNCDNDILLSHWVDRKQAYDLLAYCEKYSPEYKPYQVIHKVGEKLCHG